MDLNRVLRHVPHGVARFVCDSGILDGAWKAKRIAERQLALTAKQLAEMRAGNVIAPWLVLAEAVRKANGPQGSILEIGCSTGYHVQVLEYLLGTPLAYTGVDYSETMIGKARVEWPRAAFVVGDASDLPFPSGAFDVVISAAVIMHMRRWERAVREAARLARGWVVFHRTPILENGTAYRIKMAYGVPCAELHFGRNQFLQVCTTEGLKLSREMPVEDNQITFVFRK